MFEAARWAPSAFNAQPWSFIVATKEDSNVYNRLLHCMPAANQRWAHRAPVLLLSVTNLCHPDTGKPDRFARYDLGLAVENLVLQATTLGLFCHQTGGLNVEKARTEFNIPEESSRRILGVHMLAPQASDLLHEGVMIVKEKMTVEDVLDTLYIFPSLSEAFKKAAHSLELAKNKTN